MSYIVGEIRTFSFGSNGGLEAPQNAFLQLRRQGWLECDGTSLPISGFRNLFNAIGYSWGSEDKPHTFKIPDLRGYFLRGWDHGAGRDPEAATRAPIHLADAPSDFVGAQGDAVASTQLDEFKQHAHGHQAPRHYGAAPSTHDRAKADGRGITDPTGGKETRPLNVYVMFCVYAGRTIPDGARLTHMGPENAEA